MRSMHLLVFSTFYIAAVTAFSITSVAAVQAQELKSPALAGRSLTVPAKRAVSLDPLTEEEAARPSMVALAKSVHATPENFRQFDPVTKGQIGDTQTLTLRFASGATLLTIKSTPDFKVEQGGSCVEGFAYAANSTCTLLVRSTPQGPGNRLGRLEITDSAEVTPLFVGLGGNGYSPTISFTPSIISTVPGTDASGVGKVSGATYLAVDGGDSLYIANTGNNRIDYINSSGTIQNLTAAFGATAPIAVAVDRTGYTYFTQHTQYFALYVLTSPTSETFYQSGTNTCSIGSTCAFENANYSSQNTGALALDPGGNLFLNTFQSAARLTLAPDAFHLNYTPLYTPYNYNSDYYSSAPEPLAVDSSDNLYSFYNIGSGKECIISGESYYNAASNLTNPIAVVGGSPCGFSGDGGQARGAEIGNRIGQMTFDIAGNLYFTDTQNQRVRRVDNATGIITTIAGNGVVGGAGDGGAATLAHLSTPTGVAVDSQGQVYIISSSAISGQLVRKVGTVGAAYLGGLPVGTSSAAQTVTVSNTGNAELDFLHVGFSSGNTSDFTMDVNTTTCNFTVPLASGRSCKIGFIFKPTATGSRTAVLTMTDDTIAGVNTIQLSGTGYTTATLTPPTLTFPNTTVAVNSAALKATLTNTGKAVMTISSVLISGPSASSYSKTTTCGTTLAVAASCTISITFKPVSSGAHTATLTVTDDALTTHQTVSLSGSGVAAAKKATATTLISAANPALMRSSMVLSARVTAESLPMSNGRVQLWEGKHLWSEAALINGVAQFTIADMPRGPHMVNALYPGDNQSLASASLPMGVVVVSPILGPITRLGSLPAEQ